jgi:hypothetical protein
MVAIYMEHHVDTGSRSSESNINLKLLGPLKDFKKILKIQGMPSIIAGRGSWRSVRCYDGLKLRAIFQGKMTPFHPEDCSHKF